MEHLDSVKRIELGIKLAKAWRRAMRIDREIARAEDSICLVIIISVYRAATGKLVVDKRRYSKYVTL